jgi:hypothetical protein
MHGAATLLLREGYPDVARILVTLADVLLPLAPVRGQARTEERYARLRDLALLHFPDLLGRARAIAVAKACHHYETTCWPRDRQRGVRPHGLNGDLYDILMLGKLPKEDRLRQIFRGLGG